MNKQEYRRAWREIRRLKGKLPYIPADLSAAFQCLHNRGKIDPLSACVRRDSDGNFMDSGSNFTQAVFWTIQYKANTATIRNMCESIAFRRGY